MRGGQVQDEVLARQLRRGHGQADGVDGDVVGKEIGEDDKTSGTIDVQLAGTGARLSLNEDLAALDAELAGDFDTLGGLERGFQTSTVLGVLSKCDILQPGRRLARAGHQSHSKPGNDAVIGLHGVDFQGGGLLAEHGDNPAITHNCIALEGICRIIPRNGGHLISPAKTAGASASAEGLPVSQMMRRDMCLGSGLGAGLWRSRLE